MTVQVLFPASPTSVVAGEPARKKKEIGAGLAVPSNASAGASVARATSFSFHSTPPRVAQLTRKLSSVVPPVRAPALGGSGSPVKDGRREVPSSTTQSGQNGVNFNASSSFSFGRPPAKDGSPKPKPPFGASHNSQTTLPTSFSQGFSRLSIAEDNSNLQELDFLNRGLVQGYGAEAGDLDNAPLFTRDAFVKLDPSTQAWKLKSLVGAVKQQHSTKLDPTPKSPQLYLNVASPFSGVVCGVQGSGKSHSLSVMLESCFMSHPAIGPVPSPLSGIAFHYGSQTFGQPSEAAYLSQLLPTAKAVGTTAPEVVVLVSPSSLNTMTKAYSSLPNVVVHPLRMAHSDLNASRMLTLMGNDDESKVPLYMTSILALIRKQGSDNFNYLQLRSQIDRIKTEFNEAQRQMLALRLDLLDSFCSKDSSHSVKTFFKAGRLVIIDLSDPFLGEAAACSMFDIILGLFLESDQKLGKVIALDEAHIFLTSTSATKLIASLVAIIRLQRHIGVRTLISTQEPTCLPSAILDLVSFILAHRFGSPAWANHLDKHVATPSDRDYQWFDTVANLRTGEACLFAPSLVGVASDGGKLVKLGRGFLKVSTRARLTSDGGEIGYGLKLGCTERLSGVASEKNVDQLFWLHSLILSRLLHTNSLLRMSTGFLTVSDHPLSSDWLFGKLIDISLAVAAPRRFHLFVRSQSESAFQLSALLKSGELLTKLNGKQSLAFAAGSSIRSS